MKILFSLFLMLPLVSIAVEPPYFDTTWAFNSIDSTDPTTYVGSVYEGRGERIGPYGFSFKEIVTVEVYRFRADYVGSPSVEFQIHPEFGSVEVASAAVEVYAPVIGRLPQIVRSGLKRFWLIDGEGDTFQGGGGCIDVHHHLGLRAQEQGGLEEVLLHEASHASLDDLYKDSEEWRQAKAADKGQYISVIARDNPVEGPTQDLLAWMALDYGSNRITAWDRQVIPDIMSNRLKFYRSLHLNVFPVAEFKFLINAGLNDAWFNPATAGQGFSIIVLPSIQQVFLSWFTYETERPVSGSAFLGEAGHRWLTAFGPYDGDTAELTIELTQGGVFDQANPPAVTEDGYGTITLEFADCREGLITYEIPSLGLSGEIPIRRIAEDNVGLCEALNEPLYSGMAFVK